MAAIMPYKDPEKQKQYWKSRNEINQKLMMELREKTKIDVMNHYGPGCVCCGEKDIRFLTLDHINNNGKPHRKEVGSGHRLYRWAQKNNYPEGLQTMCFNCNTGRALNGGICPHKDNYNGGI